jgi:hypothetical protein
MLAQSGVETKMLVDEYLPLYDIADASAVEVHADVPTTWSALLDVDLIEVGKKKPIIGILGVLRTLPDLVASVLHGEHPERPPQSMRLRDLAEIEMREGGWLPLGERQNEEIALGLVGKFWRPVIEWADVSTEAFKDFDEPGFAKHVYSLSVSELGPTRTLLRAEMRVGTTDEHARKWFRRYWTFGVGSGAHVLITGLIEDARDRAEAAASAS